MSRLRHSAVWKFFDYFEGENVAVCRSCKKRIKVHSTSNLVRHLRLIHVPKIANIPGVSITPGLFE